MEKSGNKFEKLWKELFQEAEVTPREEVWTRIDTKLANQQINSYRKKLTVYKILAAASVIFALGIGFFNTSDIFKSENNLSNIADDQSTPELIASDSERNETQNIVQSQTKDQKLQNVDQQETDGTISEIQITTGLQNESSKNNPNIVVSNDENEITKNSIYATKSDQNVYSLPFLITRLNIDYHVPDPSQTPEKKIDPFVEDWFLIFEDPKDETEERKPEFWAGLNFSSGFFNPNISYGDSPANLGDQLAFMNSSTDAIETVPTPDNSIASIMRAAQPEKSSYNPEFSYGYGINLGYKFSSKFIIRGGVSYVYSNSSTQITSYIENSATNKKVPNQALYSAQIESAGVTSINNTSEEIKLNSSYEFISLPVNFGYYIVDKKIEWMLTAGISTDFFLKNTLYDPNNFLDSKEIKSGENSPYNNTYLNGILGTMINVSFAEHYLFSLEPSYRLGLSSFAKDGASFTSRPTSFQITAGISFIFR